MRPSVDLPAPRRPTSAMRPRRDGSSPSVPSTSASARRARRNSASLRPASSSRRLSHSGVPVVTSPISSASGQCSAPATWCSTRIDALPMPYSRLARCRSDTPAACATALRVRPRRARASRTRSPSAARKGFFSSSAASGAGRGSGVDAMRSPASVREPCHGCTIVLDTTVVRSYRASKSTIMHKRGGAQAYRAALGGRDVPGGLSLARGGGDGRDRRPPARRQPRHVAQRPARARRAPPIAALKAACLEGVAQGWMCSREAGGIRYGRVEKPSPALHGFSVDVVDMNDVAGPHHAHPGGRDRPRDAPRRGRPLRRARRRLARLPAGQRAPPDRPRRARAGALPAPAGPHRVHARLGGPPPRSADQEPPCPAAPPRPPSSTTSRSTSSISTRSARRRWPTSTTPAA